MSAARKMLVLTLAKTRAVLGAATRQASGLPAAEDLVGSGFVARTKDDEGTLLVEAADLEVKEVDYSGDVFRTPLAYVVDEQGALTSAPNVINQVTLATGKAKVTVQLLPAPTAADKDVVLIVDAGSSAKPLKFVAKTVANVGSVDLPVSGVPPGQHVALASAAGYNARLAVLAF
jgi:hypothetical protein